MKAIDAIYTILLEAGQPITLTEITHRILDRGLWATTGKTPERTISATLSTDLDKHGPQSRFLRVREGVYFLRTEGGQQELLVNQQPPAPNANEPNEPRTVSFTDAAEIILRDFGNKTPMHYQVITDKAQEKQLISTRGLTPAATMYAQILTEIERKKRRGEQPRFFMKGRGYIGLTVWESQGLAGLIEAHNRETRKKLVARLQDMPADEFERLTALLMAAMGFEDVEVTPYSGDRGIDVRATLVVAESIRTRMAIQVKKWRNNVQAPIVQQVRGSLNIHEQGLIITTSNFSRGAIEEAVKSNKIPVALINGEQLVDLLIENNIGITHNPFDLLELADIET